MAAPIPPEAPVTSAMRPSSIDPAYGWTTRISARWTFSAGAPPSRVMEHRSRRFSPDATKAASLRIPLFIAAPPGPGRGGVRFFFSVRAMRGVDKQRLDRLSAHFVRYVDDGRLPGWHIVVSRDGEVVYDEVYGQRDL